MTDKQLHYHLIEYLAITASHFNSGFTDDINYEDGSQRERSTLMHNWFLPPKSQFPDGYKTEIGAWFLNSDFLSTSSAQLIEYGKRPEDFSEPVIFLPRTLTSDWQFLHQQLGPPSRTYTGYMTPSGRSFWVLGENSSAFGLKFHVPYTADTTMILNRGLDPDMIRNTVTCSDELASFSDAMFEGYGAHLRFDSADRNLGFLYRNFKWDLLQPKPGQVILSMPVLLSQSIWKATDVLKHLSFPQPTSTDMRQWFSDQLAPHMAELISNALFKTGLHPEVHQQNLSVLIQGGDFHRLIYHDLQDCLHDPLTRFLLLNKNISSEKFDTSPFRTRQMLALPGEILSPDNKDKLFISLSDWWRRWLRVFGRYDRILNVLWGHDPFRETVFEDAVCAQLRLEAANNGLDLPSETQTFGLFTFMSWAQYEYQQCLLKQFFTNHQNVFKKIDESSLDIFSQGICLASTRAPWTQNLLCRWINENNGHLYTFPFADGFFVFLRSETSCHLYFHRRHEMHAKSNASP